jgi:hypothetical protein
MSSRGRAIELKASVAGRSFTPGYHRCYTYGNDGMQILSTRGLPQQSTGSPEQAMPDVWETSPWYYHENVLVTTVDDCTRRWFREFLVHGTVWTGNCDNAVHQSQRLSVKPMKSSDWPSDPLGPSWPSFPSITEWMGMLRRGIDPFERPELKTPKANLGFTQVSRSEIHSNCALASRIVSNVIVGIRSSCEVPRKFHRYFRYHQNFLILVVRYNLPIGLVRFLIGRWCVAPYSLWLRRAVTFKSYLKKVPITLVKCARQKLVEYSSEEYPTRVGSCTPSDDFSSDYESGGESELD